MIYILRGPAPLLTPGLIAMEMLKQLNQTLLYVNTGLVDQFGRPIVRERKEEDKIKIRRPVRYSL